MIIKWLKRSAVSRMAENLPRDILKHRFCQICKHLGNARLLLISALFEQLIALSSAQNGKTQDHVKEENKSYRMTYKSQMTVSQLSRNNTRYEIRTARICGPTVPSGRKIFFISYNYYRRGKFISIARNSHRQEKLYFDTTHSSCRRGKH